MRRAALTPLLANLPRRPSPLATELKREYHAVRTGWKKDI